MLHGEPEYRRRRRQEAADNEKYADREWNEATQKTNVEKIIRAIKDAVEKLERDQNQNSPKNQSERRWKIREVLGLWAAAAVGLLAIVIGNWDASQQRAVMRGQLEEMQNTTAITKVQLAPRMKIQFQIIAIQEGNQVVRWKLTPSWTNTGQTDAIDFHGWTFDKSFISTKEMDNFDFLRDPSPDEEVSESTIASGDRIWQRTATVEAAQAASIANNFMTTIVWGYIEWKDVFPGTPLHYRHWCVRVAVIRDEVGRVVMNMPEAYKAKCNKSA